MIQVRCASVTGLFAMFACAASLSATNLAPACPTASVSTYLASGFECSVGILNYTDFTFGSSPNANLTAADIIVTPVLSANGESGILEYSPASGIFSTMPNEAVDYYLAEEFIIDDGPIVSGSDLGMDPPFGDVSIAQYYCNDSVFSSPGTAGGIDPDVTCLNSDGAFAGNPQSVMVTVPNPTASIMFKPPATVFGTTETFINIGGPNSPASGFDGLTSGQDVTVVTTSTPEPTPVILFLSGLLAIGVSRKLKFLP